MAFLLSRNGPNVPCEVQRWQYFLRQQGIASVGRVDAVFGGATVAATQTFQQSHGLAQTGALDHATLDAAQALGYFVAPDDHYAHDPSAKVPTGLTSPSNEFRNKSFGCFLFRQETRPPRTDAEAIQILENCGSVGNWEDDNIVSLPNPHLAKTGLASVQRVHRLAAKKVLALWRAWDEARLLHLVISYEGDFVARYKRKQAPDPFLGHATKRSDMVPELSNHAFGSAFDICATWNPFTPERPTPPAAMGTKGCVRELVPIANSLGFFWGGHYTGTPDGMHFELAELT